MPTDETSDTTHLIPELIELSHSVKSATALCDLAIDKLQPHTPWDSAIVASLPYRPEGQLVRHLDAPRMRESFRYFVENQPRMRHELQRIRVAEEKGCGALVDSMFFTTAEREQLIFYNEVARPLGIVNILSSRVMFRGRALARVLLMRHGRSRPFDAADAERLMPLLPTLGLAYAALEAQADCRLEVELTAREHQIVELVAAGYRNHEIATTLGTSRNTVRNQLAALFDKLSVGNRAELVAVLARSR